MGFVCGACDHFQSYFFAEFYNKGIETGIMNDATYLVVNISKSLGICTTLDEFKTWCRDNDVRIIKILATPIEIPLTDEEIAAYKALHTNKPNTIITNDAGCFMEVEYVADTKTHIEQNYVPVSKYTALEERVSALEQLHV